MKNHQLKQTFGIAPDLAATAVSGRKTGVKSLATTKSTAAAAPVKLTEIAARIDVGLGNTLFIRGEGDGLSWEKGIPLACQDASTWVWSTRHANDKLVFKLLLNDVVWSVGDNIAVEAGRRTELRPQF
jgi:hypothetical protein